MLVRVNTKHYNVSQDTFFIFLFFSGYQITLFEGMVLKKELK